MFERYSERARRVLFFARYELSVVGGNTVDPAHLLLALLCDKKMQQHFSNWNIPLRDLWGQMELQATGGPKRPASVELDFNPATKRLLRLGAEEADRLFHQQIEPEHLLIALLRENDPVAAASLHAYGMTAEATREYLFAQSADAMQQPDAAAARSADLLSSIRIDRVMHLVRELAQAEPDSSEGLALVKRIDDELRMLSQLF